MTEQALQQKEEIVVIGGGLGGCLSALMLAKNPRYHITLLEKQNKLLNGASTIASRLHLGGEYPLDDQTAADCVRGAVAWKLLMPESIFTHVPPMKFLLSQADQEAGLKYGEAALSEANQAMGVVNEAIANIQRGIQIGMEKFGAYVQAWREKDEIARKYITLERYEKSYEAGRTVYEILFGAVKKSFGWSEEQTENALFGSFEKGKFFRKLEQHEFADYDQPPGSIAGGFQTQELGLNVPKMLAMIQKTIEATPNITVKLEHEVVPRGIKGNNKNYTITCKNGETLHASQVVEAGWSSGASLTPMAKDHPPVKAYRRAMLLVDLPRGFKTPPAFIMMGENGGMLSPYNDYTAVCYLPTAEAAYVKDVELTRERSNLAKDWETMSDQERAERTQKYFEKLKERFPVLEHASNPRMIIRDTLNFQKDLFQRRTTGPAEQKGDMSISAMGMALVPAPKQTQIQNFQAPGIDSRPQLEEVKKGWFKLYPTKATYSVGTALQVADMVEQRSRSTDNQLVEAETRVIKLINTPEKLQHFSLASMKTPNARDYARFFREHSDLDPKMRFGSWHEQDKAKAYNTAELRLLPAEKRLPMLLTKPPQRGPTGRLHAPTRE